jgi:hypothetical protein
MFTPAPEPHTSGALLPWAIACVVILLAIAGLAFFSHRTPKSDASTLLPLDAYASQLAFSDIVMSESTSLSGGKSTFIDGHVHNLGSRTVEGASLQVLFGNFDPTQPAQIDSSLLSLIRTHEPYIDTEPVGVAPLAPGAEKEFRLIFENISPNWNQQLPIIRAVGVKTK